MARKQIVHVAQDAIRKNFKQGTDDPAIILNEGGKPVRHHEIEICLNDGTVVGRFVQRMDSPLSCGARIWFELDKDVVYAVGK